MTHKLYGPEDFTAEEMDLKNALALAVCDGGLAACKVCGAAEAQLDEHPDCASYVEHKRLQREKT